MQALLNDLRKTEAGRQLLTDIDNAKNPVTFRLNTSAVSSGGGVTSWTSAANASNGTGDPVTVTLDPNLNNNSLFVFDRAGNRIADPPDVVAAHELSHALNVANGTFDAADPERQAINGENTHRTQRDPPLPERDPGNHGGGYNPPPPPPPPTP